MKTKKITLAIVLLLTAGLSISMQAQEHLSALVKKCETMDNVDMNVAQNKNRETKKPERVIKTLTIKDNPKLVDEFVAAFAKDKEAAYRVIEKKQEGRIVPSFYRFANGKTDISYSFSIDQKGLVTITATERYDYEDLGG